MKARTREETDALISALRAKITMLKKMVDVLQAEKADRVRSELHDRFVGDVSSLGERRYLAEDRLFFPRDGEDWD